MNDDIFGLGDQSFEQGTLIRCIQPTRLASNPEHLFHGIFSSNVVNVSEPGIIVNISEGFQPISAYTIVICVLTTQGLGWSWSGVWRLYE